MAHINDCKKTCIKCGILLDATIPFTGIPHTDVYYCDSCLDEDKKKNKITENTLLISHRDPDKEDVHILRLWLNWQTRELFFYQNNEWVSLTAEYIENKKPKLSDYKTIKDGFFPPPWNINDYPDKTEGWIEFQKYIKDNSLLPQNCVVENEDLI